jgi:hypothetical protein
MKELEWEVIKLCLLPIIGMGIKEISDEFMLTREWEYKYKFLILPSFDLNFLKKSQ